MANTTFQGPVRSLNGMYSFGPGTTVNLAANVTLSPTLHAGKLLRLNAAGINITLPPIVTTADANGTGPGSDPNTLNNQGVVYTIVVETATNASSLITTDGTDKFYGSLTLVNSVSGAINTSSIAVSTANINIKMNGSTTGGLSGSYLQITAAGPAKYVVSGVLNGSGTLATPFT